MPYLYNGNPYTGIFISRQPPDQVWQVASSSYSPSITGNPWKCNLVLVSIVAADALVLKHWVISIENANSIVISQDQTHEKLWLLIGTHLEYNSINFWEKNIQLFTGYGCMCV